MKLDSRSPTGPIEHAWSETKFNLKLVNPANKRKYKVIVVGSGLAGGSAAATLAELGYDVACFCFQDSPRRAHSIARCAVSAPHSRVPPASSAPSAIPFANATSRSPGSTAPSRSRAVPGPECGLEMAGLDAEYGDLDAGCGDLDVECGDLDVEYGGLDADGHEREAGDAMSPPGGSTSASHCAIARPTSAMAKAGGATSRRGFGVLQVPDPQAVQDGI